MNSAVLFLGDGHCALCGKTATHVCHCPQCQDMLAEDGDNPDEGRPMCNDCAHCESYASARKD